jgi:hypothetical protein
MNSIPASLFLSVTPSVLAAAAASLGMNAIMLTNNPAVPIGTVLGFGDSTEATEFFGAEAIESSLGGIYFDGFNGAGQFPSALYFAQYNTAAVAAYLRGADLGSMTLTQLQAFAGSIVVSINGETVTSAAINLASATSFSNAAGLIQTGLQTAGGIFNGTGTTTNASAVLTINSTVSGELHVGDTVVGTDIPAATTILSFGTYTVGAGTGTVNLSANATGAAGPEAVTVSSTATCTYDSVRNAFVITSPTTGATSSIAYPTTSTLPTDLLLTAATGAVLSQGAAAAVPGTLMTALTGISQDWATFMSTFDPDNGAAGGPIKQQFATWNSEQDDYYMYVAWDTDATPSTVLPDTACFAQQIAALSGTFPIWDQTATQAASVAAFVCGLTASIQFNAPGGRTSFAYRSSPALAPTLTSPTIFMNVTGTNENPGNGYNTYASFATRTSKFQWLQLGTVSGPFDWADSYVNQIYWNSQFQNDFATYESNVKNIPYTQQGYGGIHQALAADIQTMGSFGAWVAGVELSSEQQAEVNSAAGIAIANVLMTQGWYLLVADPGSSARQARSSPIVQYYYCDGESVQAINMSSTDVQ